jgi:hypothetical protein
MLLRTDVAAMESQGIQETHDVRGWTLREMPQSQIRKQDEFSVLAMLLAILCAGCFGFAAQRGSLCVVSAVAAILDKGSAQVFLSFLRCVLWVALIGLPVTWLWPGGHPVPAYPTSLASIVGGLVFGVGAAIKADALSEPL